MKRIFDTLFSAFRAKATAFWNRVRLLFTLSFWQTKVVAKARQFFSRLFDVRPRDKNDYYPVFRWLVSKRLAYALVISLCVCCLLLLWRVAADLIPRRDAGAVPTYRYDSLLLKFYNGQARVTARDGHVAYVGAVERGAAEGQGSLYNSSDALVYEGMFSNSKYNGTGTLYYPGGGVRYTGNFVDNLYDGMGKDYRANGTLEYEGAYSRGKRMGAGKLYGASGNLIYNGSFRGGAIVFDELLGKTMAEAAQMYIGAQLLYTTESESCIDMREIGVVCGLKDGSNSLEPEWKIDTVFIPRGELLLDGQLCRTVSEAAAQLGLSEYEGETPVLLPEAVVINLLEGDGALRFGRVEMESEAAFEEAITVHSYDRAYLAYIYSFSRDGLLYTFYVDRQNGEQFDFYSIAKAE
ncbi:MAG: hypothetical protein MR935_02985 [Agathobaculum sp.]|uniref:hypothetical protein n=1 Tax=Agathobaculum sp. TaxID=2048138 RepID=UPI0025C27B73|nr:hypothetical protein [Agathobaculum sp.]MCI7125157.1 hypothetical protein [Agathobaculum sp.]MDY3711670.1 hypothetical protein [Agathobaculum sp.]